MPLKPFNSGSLLPKPNRQSNSVLQPKRPKLTPLQMIVQKEVTFKIGWCHLGDAVCLLTVARKFARQRPDIKVYIDGYADVIQAYGDNLLNLGNRGQEIAICPVARHRRKEPGDDFNYCGTYENEYGLQASPTSAPELPTPAPFPDLINVPYVVLQPFARWAKPDLTPDFVQELIDVCHAAHFRVVCVGTWETRQCWNTIDYSHLGPAINLMRAIRHASLVLTPRSASAHIAAAYKTRSLVWVPGDGENWHLNYKDWPNTQVSVYTPPILLAAAKRMIDEALVLAGQKLLDHHAIPMPKPIEIQTAPAATPIPAEVKKIRSIVVTMSIGDAESKICAISHPLMKAYAKRIGADFHFIHERRWPDVHVFFEKYQMYDLIRTYDRTLYVDTDVLIRNTAPNIFDLVPAGQIGVFNEVSMAKDLGNIETCRTRILQLLDLMGGPPPDWVWDGTYFNAGIQVLDPTFAWMSEKKPEGAFRNVLLGDQGLLNMWIQYRKLPVYHLPQTWNHMIGHTRMAIPDACASNYFIHATWYKDKRLRDQVMQMIANAWQPTPG